MLGHSIHYEISECKWFQFSTFSHIQALDLSLCSLTLSHSWLSPIEWEGYDVVPVQGWSSGECANACWLSCIVRLAFTCTWVFCEKTPCLACWGDVRGMERIRQVEDFEGSPADATRSWTTLLTWPENSVWGAQLRKIFPRKAQSLLLINKIMILINTACIKLKTFEVL